MMSAIDPALATEQQALRHLDPINEAVDRGDSLVQQFYDGATVFLTGGSGFLGKQLTEKLFRACNIRKLYILLRPKKGKLVTERLQEMLTDPVFEPVRKKKPKFADKIVSVVGDVAAIKLGISDNDWNMLTQEVDVIFHVAATTRFDETLTVATLINVRGTREALKLANACPKLRSFVHVSTAYANATEKTLREEIQEKFYSPAIPPETLIGLVENVEEQRLKEIEAAFIKGYPNTYTFAKSVAEAEVRSWSGKFPVCIVRPAIVISAYKEPSPGWTDLSCAYGTSGIVTGPTIGLMHVSYGNADTEFNIVPVDYVNNALIVAGYETGKAGKTEEPKIYAVASANNMLSWRYLAAKLSDVCIKLPTPAAVWYCFVFVTSNVPLFLLLSWILHFIPGYIMDGVCILLRKKPRFKRLTRRMYNISRALSYFTTHSWIFSDGNTDKLYQSLCETDKVIFNFNTNDINHEEFVTLWYIGLRKYIYKDGLQNTEHGLKKQFWFRILHTIVCVMYFYILWQVIAFMYCCIYHVLSIF